MLEPRPMNERILKMSDQAAQKGEPASEPALQDQYTAGLEMVEVLRAAQETQEKKVRPCFVRLCPRAPPREVI